MTNRRTLYILAAVTALVAFILYLPVLRNGFVEWDDKLYVTDNFPIRSFSIRFILWTFTPFADGNWFPITLMSHALDYTVWGLDPAGHHLSSMLIHALNTFLVVLLTVRLLEAARRAQRGEDTGSALSRFPDERFVMITAVVTGLLFGLHPLHVESVAWVSERKDLLCGLFFLLSMLSYAGYAAAAAEERCQRTPYGCWQNKRYIVSFVWFLFALMSKPMAVSLPIAMLILDWYPFRRIRSLGMLWDACLEKAPFVAGSLIVSLLTFFAQRTAGAMEYMVPLSAWTRVFVAAKAYLVYLLQVLFPMNLSPYYPYPRVVSLLSPGYVLAVAAFVGLSSCVIAVAGRHKLWLAAWGFYFVTLLPVIGIVQVGGQAMADRYMYLPSLAPFLVVGLAAARVDARTHSVRLASHFVAAAAFCLLVVLSMLTVRQIDVWKDGIGLWSAVIQSDAEHAPLVYVNRGYSYLQAGNIPKAIEDFNTALGLNPTYDKAFLGRAIASARRGDLDRARKDFTMVISLNPAFREAYIERAHVLEQQGQLKQALEDYGAVLSQDPRSADAYSERGHLLKVTGETERAIEDFTAAIDIDHYNVQALTERGVTFEELGQYGRALEDLSRAVELDPSNAYSRIHYGIVLKELGRYQQAIEEYTQAIRVDPMSKEAFNNRGVAYRRTGNFVQAIEDYDRAIKIDPLFALAYCNRGIVQGERGRYPEAIEDYTRAISISPDLVRAYLGRGELYAKTRRTVLAGRDFQQACGLGSEPACAALRAYAGQ